MGHLEHLKQEARTALRDARVAEMVSTMFNLEAHYCERRDETLRRIRAIFPTLTDAAEESRDYDRAYAQLRHYCRFHDLY